MRALYRGCRDCLATLQKCIKASHALCSEQNLKLLNQPYVRVNAITIGQTRLGIAMNSYI